MAEAMTVESIVEAYWQLQDYWTKLRFPIQIENGSWTDIDILAYHPERKILVISESKVRGQKNDIWAYTKYTREEKKRDIFEARKHRTNYLSFLNSFEKICTNDVIFSNFDEMVKKITIQLVSNLYVDDEVLDDAKDDVCKEIKKMVPKEIVVRIEDIRFDTTFDIICEIIKIEKERDQGRRYGHPVIDLARELNRYLNDPSINSAGRDTDRIKSKFKNKLKDILELG